MGTPVASVGLSHSVIAPAHRHSISLERSDLFRENDLLRKQESRAVP